MDTIKSYCDLIVWQKGMELVVELYRYAELFPKSELYGLVSQMCRAAVAIPSNIAEGSRRRYPKERTQFFTIAYSSGAELETQVELSKKLFPSIKHDRQRLESLLDEVMRMLNKMTNN